MRRPIFAVGLAGLVLLIWPATAFAATDPLLNTAGNFAVLSGAGMTNTGPSWITGAIGASSAGITGFPPGTAGPQHIGDSAYTTAETDLVGTFTRAAAEPTTTDYSNVNLGGLTLGPGVYNQSTAPTLTGTLDCDVTMKSRRLLSPSTTTIWSPGRSVASLPKIIG